MTCTIKHDPINVQYNVESQPATCSLTRQGFCFRSCSKSEPTLNFWSRQTLCGFLKPTFSYGLDLIYLQANKLSPMVPVRLPAEEAKMWTCVSPSGLQMQSNSDSAHMTDSTFINGHENRNMHQKEERDSFQLVRVYYTSKKSECAPQFVHFSVSYTEIPPF